MVVSFDIKKWLFSFFLWNVTKKYNNFIPNFSLEQILLLFIIPFLMTQNIPDLCYADASLLLTYQELIDPYKNPLIYACNYLTTTLILCFWS